ncbi:non-ribosomal peptide synthetase/type I polyketide synthase [Shouchella hunanensis]|uniref:Amino acid adenylation domain-containing protein n=1 Tax=Shouchella hunanensis TaxID=766894 RepID=A0ABY7W0F9_9BACI|nr:non-ribosomal peptide synthetase/type I polyketide synthase [Shouchella hunanensis]WDF02031.1 amino acid adenylation domain-containing protein [Shouchella hunanensis]
MTINNQTDVKKNKRVKKNNVENKIYVVIIEELCKLTGEINVDEETGFFDTGLDSNQILLLQEGIEDRLNITLSSTATLDYPNVKELFTYINSLLNKEKSDLNINPINAKKINTNRDVAVVGMSCRFPGGANTPEEFWEVLINNIDPIKAAPKERWKLDPLANDNVKTIVGGYLDKVDEFDPLFFGISIKEAEALDPQHRILLELTWEAIEDAGWDPKDLEGSKTGVFIGITNSDYSQVGRDYGITPGPYSLTGTMNNSASGRISYTYGFNGPSISIDTACSSSIVAVQQAIMNLREGTCGVAIAAGVNLILRSESHASFSSLQALSPSGRCRSFDSMADGYIRSEGAALVVLKPLEDAIKNGDTIYGVLKGVSTNHDGQSGGYTVPNGRAQQSVIKEALKDAGLKPQDIDYIEAHGSGTKIGDPQEVNSLQEIFKERNEPALLGSVKSNIGHTEVVAGMAGLFKILLSLRYNQIPANLHYNKGNPLINWEKNSLKIIDKNTKWEKNAINSMRRAGLTSIGINGTNAHLIVEEAPEIKTNNETDMVRDYQLFTISSRNERNLKETIKELVKLCESPNVDLENLCQNLNLKRSLHDNKISFSTNTLLDLQEKLKKIGSDIPSYVKNHITDKEKPVVFLFTGQGSQYLNMARDLYEDSNVFRDTLTKLSKAFIPYIKVSIIDILYKPSKDNHALGRALYTQPIIFSVQVALVELWKSLGIEPDYLIGHSIGEYAAAYADGMMELKDAIYMVATRAEIMDQSNATGEMLSILATIETVRELIKDYPDISIAAINTTENITISGSSESISFIKTKANKARIFVEKLDVTNAYHSNFMKADAEKLTDKFKTIIFRRPTSRFISTVTGSTSVEKVEINSEYWGRQLKEPVLFSQAINTVDSLGGKVFLEIGTTATLAGLVAQILPSSSYSFLVSLRKAGSNWKHFLESVGKLWELGYKINFKALYNKRMMRTKIPVTKFDKKKIWFSEPERIQQKIVINKKDQTSNNLIMEVDAEFEQNKVSEGLYAVISKITGITKSDITDTVNLFSLGFDSLMMVHLKNYIQDEYQIEVPTNVFYMDLQTIEAIKSYIVRHFSQLKITRKDNLITEINNENCSLEDTGKVDIDVIKKTRLNGHETFENLINRQLDIMEKQIDLIEKQSEKNFNQIVTTPPKTEEKKMRAMRPLANHTLNERQLSFLDEFTDKWTTKTSSSRDYAVKYRESLVDWIENLNYDHSLKKIVYPIVSVASKGSKFTDIDGNEFIDTSMGFGVSFFGHSPEFITKAIKQQLEKGMELGPQSAVVGEVTDLIKELTGTERVTYCNSGTEAVMASLRIARSVTKKNKIVKFTNSYHGTFDGILAEVTDRSTGPQAIGTPDSMVEDTVVLSYGTYESLETIETLGNSLAAVLVEPVQSRNPNFQPKEFLKKLREVCSKNRIALIFDEMITGFRVMPGGAQQYFGVNADIVTYGKLIGGGMPLGIIAGKKDYLDILDGGYWGFNDNSYPSANVSSFGGTFCKHPLTMAATKAALQKIKQEGSDLISKANSVTNYLVREANQFFEREFVPLKLDSFGSMYRFQPGVSKNMSTLSYELNLFFRIMMDEGIYIWERRTCVMSVEHTKEDVKGILNALRRSVKRIREGGFEFRSIPTSPLEDEHLNKKSEEQPSISEDTQNQELSEEESRVFFLSNLKGGNEAYQIKGVYNLSGKIDVSKLKRSFEEISKIHEALRASYCIQNNSVKRIVSKEINQEYEVFDLRKSTSKKAYNDFWDKTFDLSIAPLWRWALVTHENGEQKLHLNFHHIIADGGSLNILMQDLMKFFNGESILEPEKQYTDYIIQSKSYINTSLAQSQKKWWESMLSPAPPSLNLPTDASRPEVNTFQGKSVYFNINIEVLNQVRELAKQTSSTVVMVFLAIWVAFLGRLSNQTDFCVGVPWDQRNNGNFNRTVGMFAETLPIRVQPAFSQSFLEILQEIKDCCLNAYGNSNYSLNRLLDDLEISRDMSRNPIFDVMFNYENDLKRIINLDGVEVKLGETDVKNAQFDLFLDMFERKEGVFCNLTYSSEIYSEKRVTNWIGYFKQFLDNTLNDPNILLKDISFLSKEESNNILKNGEGPKYEISEDLSINQLLVDSFQNNSSNSAVITNSENVSYSDLEYRSNRLATAILNAGVEPGERIAILLPRTPNLMVALLACIKTGCTFIPVDLNLPTERINYMLNDSQVKLILNDTGIAPLNIKSINVLDNLNNEVIEINEKRSLNDTAYILYTSGSTGKPKGVEITNEAFINFIIGITSSLELADNPRFACLTTVSFDIFLLETIVCLVNNGCIILGNENETRDPELIKKLVLKGKVNCLQMTPTRLKLLSSNPIVFKETLYQIQTLVVGGESFPTELLETLREFENLRVFNVYGPTETCIWSTFKELTVSNAINVGSPIMNTNVYILDENMNILPEGIEGDLWIGGKGLSKGYINLESLTLKRFRNNPFKEGKIYLTGDKAFWKNGEIVYCGRSDDQVKIRGYRIEIGEIETILNNHPEIEFGAVAIKQIDQSEGEIIAYYKSKIDISESEIRQWLQKTLPNYMMPSYIMKTDAIPQNQNGKIIRELLPTPVLKKSSETIDYSNSDSEVIKLIHIWKRILGSKQIGLNDSFFDLGGNSLKIVLLHSEIENIYPGLVSVADLFSSPTITKLNELLIQKKKRKLPLKEVQMPSEWFDKNKTIPEKITRVVKPETVEGIKELATDFNVESTEILTTIFAFYLSKVTNNKYIPIYSIVEFDEFSLQEFDFTKGTDLSTVLNLVANNGLNKKTISNNQMSNSLKDRSIYIGFGSIDKINNKQKLNMKIALEQGKNETKIHFILCESMNEKKIQEHFENYLGILDSLVRKKQVH